MGHTKETRGSFLKSAGEGVSAFLTGANHVRRNLLRLYRKQKFQISHLYLFPAALLYFELLLRVFGGGFFQHLWYPILFGLAGGLLLTGVTSVWKPRVNRRISLVLLFLLGLLFTVECLIRGSYQVYMTIGSIVSGSHNVLARYKSDLLNAIFFGIPKISLFFLPAILYTATGKRRMPARRYPMAFGGILAGLALVLILFGSLTAGHGKYREIYSGHDFNAATKTFGLMTSLRLDAKSVIFGRDSGTGFRYEEPEEPAETVAPEVPSQQEPQEEEPVVYGDNVMDLDLETLMESGDESIASLSEYVNSLTPTKKNAYTGLFAGKNLIMICAEAFSDAAIIPELTPTLYRLSHNGFYFSDFYQPAWGGSTTSGEFSMLMGLSPLRGSESMFDTEYTNNYFTLGNQLQRQGYYSAAYHAGLFDVYSRDNTHVNLGYGAYLGIGNGLEDIVGTDHTDTTLFDLTMDTYMDKQPFSIYYMTISGHCTYLPDSEFVKKYENQVRAVVGDKYKDTTVYYLCYQMELENALTVMVEKLEQAGIADDTVICMTSDHYPYGLAKSDTFGNSEDYVVDLYGGDYQYDWERDRNALIIWSGCLEHENKDMACEVATPSYTLDIVPTLLNLFGLEYDSRLLIGRDVFSDAEPLVLWNTYSWVTERGKYCYSEDKFFPAEGYEEDPAYTDKIIQRLANKLNFSDQVLVNDYYGVLFGPDTVVDNSQFIPKATAALQGNTTAGSTSAVETKNTASDTPAESEKKRETEPSAAPQ